MIISFGWTAPLLPPAGTKDTTRRIWAPRTLTIWQKAWDKGRLEHDAVDKCLAYGGKRIGRIVLKERPFLQPLSEMVGAELVREGMRSAAVPDVDTFVTKYFGGDRSQIVAVVRFEFHPTETRTP
jgi:hypothetical protein